MNGNNFNAVTISKEDYFALPPEMRMQSPHGPMVLSVVRGNETFVKAEIVELHFW